MGFPALWWSLLVSALFSRKVEDLQFRVEEESITKGDLEVLMSTFNPCQLGQSWINRPSGLCKHPPPPRLVQENLNFRFQIEKKHPISILI